MLTRSILGTRRLREIAALASRRCRRAAGNLACKSSAFSNAAAASSRRPVSRSTSPRFEQPDPGVIWVGLQVLFEKYAGECGCVVEAGLWSPSNSVACRWFFSASSCSPCRARAAPSRIQSPLQSGKSLVSSRYASISSPLSCPASRVSAQFSSRRSLLSPGQASGVGPGSLPQVGSCLTVWAESSVLFDENGCFCHSVVVAGGNSFSPQCSSLLLVLRMLNHQLGLPTARGSRFGSRCPGRTGR